VRIVPIAVLALLPALAGCSVIPEAKAQDVSGAVDGYDPTASFLKVHVHTAERIVLVVFDRRDWNVMGIAKAIDERDVKALSIHGMPREILNEVLVETVGDPTSLARFRWADSTYTPEERDAFEAAYDELVAKHAPPEVTLPAPATPTLMTPAVPTV
jgi:hypothetical protein